MNKYPLDVVAVVIKQWLEEGRVEDARDLLLRHLHVGCICPTSYQRRSNASHLLHLVDATAHDALKNRAKLAPRP